MNDSSIVPTDWSCLSCPDGASCDGTPYFGVKAKFGYYRVPSKTIPNKFVACLYPGACLGAPNTALLKRYKNKNESIDYAKESFPESCNTEMGFQTGSRQCHACRIDFRRLGRARCATCPTSSNNILLLCLGVVLVIVAIVFFIKMTVADAGRTKISESIQKIIINYLQVITIFAGFPLRWPKIMESLFDFQGSISTVGDHFLNPDCASNYSSAVELFYAKQIAYTSLPIVLSLIVWLTWHSISKCQKIQYGLRLNLLDTTPKDKFVISLCVLMYLIYPTLCKQAFGLFNCQEVESGRYFLLADLEEECYWGQNNHLLMAMTFGIFQIVFYVVGLPALGVYFMFRNHHQLNKHVVRTRYGLFLGGYRDERYYWEIFLVARKVIIIAISVFGTLLSVSVQTHIVSLFILLFMLAEAVGQPFDSTSGDVDRFGTPRVRYKVLHQLEMISLFVIWLTLWCGMLIYQVDDINSNVHVVLTIAVFSLNVTLMSFMVFKFISEVVCKSFFGRELVCTNFDFYIFTNITFF